LPVSSVELGKNNDYLGELCEKYTLKGMNVLTLPFSLGLLNRSKYDPRKL